MTCSPVACGRPLYLKEMCQPHYNRDYYARNKAKRLAKLQEWNDANPEKVQGYKKSWRDNNKERYRETSRQWKLDNPDRVREMGHQRRMKLANVLSDGHTEFEMLALYGSDCHICGEAIDLAAPRRAVDGEGWQQGLHREHVISLHKGGEDTLENCRPAHAICNLRKGRT